MDTMRKVHKCVHLQFGFAEFDTVVCERNLEKLVLSNENDVVVLGWVKLACGVRWFGWVTRGVEAVQILSINVAGGCWTA